MRAGLAIVVCLAVLPIRGIAAQQRSQTAAVANGQVTATRTVWDGVYTTRQSERGRRLYAAHCAAATATICSLRGLIRSLATT